MITGRDLIDKLPLLNQRLDTCTEAVELGGTAMTLLGIKDETRDVDFILEEGDTNLLQVNIGVYMRHGCRRVWSVQRVFSANAG